MRRTGLLGGTFDPVHNGHLALAQAAFILGDLEEIIFIPAAVPPHKQEARISRYEHRVAMLEAAVQQESRMSVSTIERDLPTPSYTVDTLQHLLSANPENRDFFFITGADSFLDILSWKECRELLQLINFMVFSRAGADQTKLFQLFHTLGYQRQETSWWNSQFKKRIYASSQPLPPVSSSEIRERVVRGLPFNHLLPENVVDYILKHRLYHPGKNGLS